MTSLSRRKETHLTRYTFAYILRISKGDCFWYDDLKIDEKQHQQYPLICQRTISLENGLAQNSVTLIGEKSASPSFAHFDWVHSIRSPLGSPLQVKIAFTSEAVSSLEREEYDRSGYLKVTRLCVICEFCFILIGF